VGEGQQHDPAALDMIAMRIDGIAQQPFDHTEDRLRCGTLQPLTA
jgi:hypothetical protein